MPAAALHRQAGRQCRGSAAPGYPGQPANPGLKLPICTRSTAVGDGPWRQPNPRRLALQVGRPATQGNRVLNAGVRSRSCRPRCNRGEDGREAAPLVTLVIPAQAGIQARLSPQRQTSQRSLRLWVPAFAGTTHGTPSPWYASSLTQRIRVRQDKPGRGGCDDVANDIAETSERDPAGSQSRPAKAGPQPEASLAWPWATVDVKRRQRVGGPCDAAPKV